MSSYVIAHQIPNTQILNLLNDRDIFAQSYYGIAKLFHSV